MIAAMTRDRVIGTGQGIPWHLPRDSAHFRAYTAGKCLLLGRKTYEEMLGWFTTQTPIVLTKSPNEPLEGEPSAVSSVEEAITLARLLGAEELVVSGGAQVYALAIEYADTLVLTRVQAVIPGQAVFPDFESSSAWHCDRRQAFDADAENAHAMEFQWWSRQLQG